MPMPPPAAHQPRDRHLHTWLPSLTALASLTLTAVAGAADTPADHSLGAPAPAVVDPTTLVVASGHEIYRQRDIDALVLIATRYNHGSLTAVDEDQLRHALSRILVAREPLLECLETLPAVVSHGKSGDAYLLDLLDYQAEAAPARTIPQPAVLAAMEPVPATAAGSTGPVLIALPPLLLVRTLAGVGKRQLSMHITLRFADQATSRHFETQAAIIRDAILGCMDGLTPGDFLEPKQLVIKQALVKAITAQIADFPVGAVLIPELDAGPSQDDPAPDLSPKAPSAGRPGTSASPANPPAHP